MDRESWEFSGFSSFAVESLKTRLSQIKMNFHVICNDPIQILIVFQALQALTCFQF